MAANQSKENLGTIQWHPSVCPHHRWFRMVVQLFKMQQDIAQAKRHTTGTGIGR